MNKRLSIAKKIFDLATFYKIDEGELCHTFEMSLKFDDVSKEELVTSFYPTVIRRVLKKKKIRSFRERKEKYKFSFLVAKTLPKMDNGIIKSCFEVLANKKAKEEFLGELRAIRQWKGYYLANDFYISAFENFLIKYCLQVLGEKESIDLWLFYHEEKGYFSFGYFPHQKKYDVGLYSNTHERGLLLYLFLGMDISHLVSKFKTNFDLDILGMFHLPQLKKVLEPAMIDGNEIEAYKKNPKIYAATYKKFSMLVSPTCGITLFTNGKKQSEIVFACEDFFEYELSTLQTKTSATYIFRKENKRAVVSISNGRVRLFCQNIASFRAFCSEKLTEDFIFDERAAIEVFSKNCLSFPYVCKEMEFTLPTNEYSKIDNSLLDFACCGEYVYVEAGKKEWTRQVVNDISVLQAFGYFNYPLVHFSGKSYSIPLRYSPVLSIEQSKKMSAYVVSEELLSKKYYGKKQDILQGFHSYFPKKVPLIRGGTKHFLTPIGLLKYNSLMLNGIDFAAEDMDTRRVYSAIYTNSEEADSCHYACNEGIISYNLCKGAYSFSLRVDLYSGNATIKIINAGYKDKVYKLCFSCFGSCVYSGYLRVPARKKSVHALSLYKSASFPDSVQYFLQGEDNQFLFSLRSFLFCAVNALPNSSPLVMTFYGILGLNFSKEFTLEILLTLSRKQNVAGDFSSGNSFLYCYLLLEFARVYGEDVFLLREPYSDCDVRDTLKYHLLKAVNVKAKNPTSAILKYMVMKRLLAFDSLIENRGETLNALSVMKKKLQEKKGGSILFSFLQSVCFMQKSSKVFSFTRISKELACIWHFCIGDCERAKKMLQTITARRINGEAKNDIIYCLFSSFYMAKGLGIAYQNGGVSFSKENPLGVTYRGKITCGTSSIKVLKGKSSEGYRVNGIKTNFAFVEFAAGKSAYAVDING